MIKQLFYKWFGLEKEPCQVCEVLREQLAKSESERSQLLMRALTSPNLSEPPPIEKEELKPIQSQFVPWRVRQQMLESEDRKKAQLMRDKAKEIAELEKELGIAKDLERGSSGGLKVEFPDPLEVAK